MAEITTRGYRFLFLVAVLAQITLALFAFFVGLVLLPTLWLLLIGVATAGLVLMLAWRTGSRKWLALGIPTLTVGITILALLFNTLFLWIVGY